MNAIETEADAALAWEYERVLSDKGAQAESVKIDGTPIPGNLSFDKQEIDLVPGGWNQDIKGMFSTLKSYFKGDFPKPMNSHLECTVRGQIRDYQIIDLNGDNDNRANLNIGLGAYHNRKS